MNRIKELRIQNGWRQQDLAARLNTNQQTVGRYETGARGLDVETIFRLCEIFDVSADYLLGRADDRSREMVRLALAPFTTEAITAASAK